MRRDLTDAVGGLSHLFRNPIRTGFRELARLRHAHAFHPRGLVLSGELTVHAHTTLPLPSGSSPVLARVSKGAGVPGGGPDVLGLALRVPLGPQGADPWDILLSTAGTGTLTRMLPRPVATWDGATYCTIEPYRTDARYVWLLATPAGHPSGPAALEPLRHRVQRHPLRFTLHESGRDRQWQEVAELTLHTLLPEDDEPAFDPMTRIPSGVRLAPRWLSRLRELAYHGSREGRGPARP